MSLEISIEKKLDGFTLRAAFTAGNTSTALLGASGCGKSMTLRCIAGIVQPDKGRIVLDGRVLFDSEQHIDLPPQQRGAGLLFQNYALFPNMNVAENIAFGLRIKKKSKAYIDDKIKYALKLVNLDGYEKRKIDALSGGQQQRIAIARAIVNEPKVLLLDEPLGALDLKMRQDMQYELIRLKNELGITFVYVTHDQEEALTMSDTGVVMNGGKVQQIGTPEDIYNEPVNAFVADFIGESNIVDAVMVRDYVVRFGGVTLDCLDSGIDPNEFVEDVERPEDIQLCDPGHKAALTGTITDVVFKGVFFEIFVDVGGFIWMVQPTHYHAAGNTVGMYIEPDAIHIMKRSEYSGEFGDYSTFSDEMDHFSDAEYNWEEERNELSGE